MENDIICVVGLPTSGKTTIVNYIADKYKYNKINGGEYLRELIRREPNSDHSKEIQKSILSGEPVQVNIIMEYVKTKIVSNKGIHILLDGIPKNVEYLNHLNKLLFDVMEPNFKLRLIELKITIAEVFKRIQQRYTCIYCSNTGISKKCNHCGKICIKRNDDLNRESVKNRIRYYKQHMPRVIGKLKESYDYYEINTEKDLNMVKKNVDSFLLTF